MKSIVEILRCKNMLLHTSSLQGPLISIPLVYLLIVCQNASCACALSSLSICRLMVTDVIAWLQYYSVGMLSLVSTCCNRVSILCH